ncbi:hypothetical protein BV898_16146 [Hypsibius exemplaris]|uniref:Uncharacterized protein n=1 Tax=Hypsibius exemplaris TaxID=2072580 RepID=A0A9X6NCP3_HYPEX|nr:hypothetical protein BV898_16146 [Hypsibius exemplaris]
MFAIVEAILGVWLFEHHFIEVSRIKYLKLNCRCASSGDLTRSGDFNPDLLVRRIGCVPLCVARSDNAGGHFDVCDGTAQKQAVYLRNDKRPAFFCMFHLEEARVHIICLYGRFPLAGGTFGYCRCSRGHAFHPSCGHKEHPVCPHDDCQGTDKENGETIVVVKVPDVTTARENGADGTSWRTAAIFQLYVQRRPRETIPVVLSLFQSFRKMDYNADRTRPDAENAPCYIDSFQRAILPPTAFHPCIDIVLRGDKTPNRHTFTTGLLLSFIRRFDSCSKEMLQQMVGQMEGDIFLITAFRLRAALCGEDLPILEASIVLHALDKIFSWPLQFFIPMYGRENCPCADPRPNRCGYGISLATVQLEKKGCCEAVCLTDGSLGHCFDVQQKYGLFVMAEEENNEFSILKFFCPSHF